MKKKIFFQKFCSKIAKAEGKKVQVSIGNIREVVRLVMIEVGRMWNTTEDTQMCWEKFEDACDKAYRDSVKPKSPRSRK